MCSNTVYCIKTNPSRESFKRVVVYPYLRHQFKFKSRLPENMDDDVESGINVRKNTCLVTLYVVYNTPTRPEFMNRYKSTQSYLRHSQSGLLVARFRQAIIIFLTRHLPSTSR